jgi:hypothetical protein
MGEMTRRMSNFGEDEEDQDARIALRHSSVKQNDNFTN